MYGFVGNDPVGRWDLRGCKCEGVARSQSFEILFRVESFGWFNSKKEHIVMYSWYWTASCSERKISVPGLRASIFESRNVDSAHAYVLGKGNGNVYKIHLVADVKLTRPSVVKVVGFAIAGRVGGAIAGGILGGPLGLVIGGIIGGGAMGTGAAKTRTMQYSMFVGDIEVRCICKQYRHSCRWEPVMSVIHSRNGIGFY